MSLPYSLPVNLRCYSCTHTYALSVKALACKELFAQSEGKLNLSRALHCAMMQRGGRQQIIWMVVVSSLSIGYMKILHIYSHI